MDRKDSSRLDSETSIHSRRSGGSSLVTRSTGDSRSSAESLTKDEGRFTWKNQWQHTMFFLAYTFSWDTFASYMHGEIDAVEYQPTFIHCIIVYILFIGPTIFLETFLGQYTQKGCIVIGAMLPVAYGLGFCFLLVSLIDAIVNLYYNSVILYYVLLAAVNWLTPSWMMCLPESYEYNPNCFSISKIDSCEPCFKNEKITQSCFKQGDKFSAEIFKDLVVLGVDPSNQIYLGYPNFKQFFHLFICSILILLLATRELRELDGSIRICNIFALISSSLIIVIVVMHSGRMESLFAVFIHIDLESFKNIGTWLITFKRLVHVLRIATGGHILFGSFLSISVNSRSRVLNMNLIHGLALLIISMLTFTIKDYLACRLNMKVEDFQRLLSHDLTFVIYPTALGILPAAPLWSTVYFLILFTLTMHSVALQIITIEENLSSEFLNESYYIYTRVLIFFLAFLGATVLVTPKGSFLVRKIIIYRSLILMVNTCLFYVVIFIYGITKLSDDVHFLLRNPSSFFLKLFCVATPFVSALTFFYFISSFNIDRFKEILIIIICVYVSPLVAGMIYKIILGVKAKNLTGLLMPADHWGPPDVETRTARRLYTPRFEVRFRRRFDKCKHRCLLNSPILLKTLEKELALLSNVLLEIEDNEEERETKKNVVAALRRHRDIMANFIAEKSLQKNYTMSEY